MTELDRIGRFVVRLAHQRRNRGADLDADGIAFCRENARIGRAVGRDLAGLVLVTVQAVDANRVERFEVALPHPGEGTAVEPRVVGDEADDTLARLLGDALFRHAGEPHIKIVQPLSLGTTHAPRRAIRHRQFAFLVHRHARKAVVG